MGNVVTATITSVFVGLIVALLLTGCSTAPNVTVQWWTEGYQQFLYGTTFQPGTPCTTAQVWDGRICHPKTGGAS